MEFRTRVCEIFGIERPIFGFSHSIPVTAAISRAGGLGVFGATMHEPDQIKEIAREIRALAGDRPFALDLLLPQSVGDDTDLAEARAAIPKKYHDFVEGIRQRHDVPPSRAGSFYTRNLRSQTLFAAQVEAALASDADVFAAAVGVPAEVISRARAAGKKTMALIGAPKHAQRALDAGVDVLIAQGYDAGAHTGTIGTFSLVPQIVDIAGDVPVLAAGGVGSGRHLAASLAMGAQGVWMGTAWLVTTEHRTDPIVLEKLLAAKSDDTVISRSYSGKTLRMIRTAWSDEWNRPDAPEPLKMPHQQALVGELLAAVREHRIAPLMWEAAGQSIAYFNEVTTVAGVMDKIMDEARDAARAVAALG
ncbi:MAG: nitronate monooxygenase [Pararhodobacter sp.]|nr:nitronate monooxygenase [Pararhodobacter sp.]